MDRNEIDVDEGVMKSDPYSLLHVLNANDRDASNRVRV
jgi:hypothetical protein